MKLIRIFLISIELPIIIKSLLYLMKFFLITSVIIFRYPERLSSFYPLKPVLDERGRCEYARHVRRTCVGYVSHKRSGNRSHSGMLGERNQRRRLLAIRSSDVHGHEAAPDRTLLNAYYAASGLPVGRARYCPIVRMHADGNVHTYDATRELNPCWYNLRGWTLWTFTTLFMTLIFFF